LRITRFVPPGTSWGGDFLDPVGANREISAGQHLVDQVPGRRTASRTSRGRSGPVSSTRDQDASSSVSMRARGPREPRRRADRPRGSSRSKLLVASPPRPARRGFTRPDGSPRRRRSTRRPTETRARRGRTVLGDPLVADQPADGRREPLPPRGLGGDVAGIEALRPTEGRRSETRHTTPGQTGPCRWTVSRTSAPRYGGQRPGRRAADVGICRNAARSSARSQRRDSSSGSTSAPRPTARALSRRRSTSGRNALTSSERGGVEIVPSDPIVPCGGYGCSGG